MADLAAQQIVRRGSVLWRRVGDEVLIRRRGLDELTVLAGGGAALWDAMTEPATVASLAEQLALAHDTARETVLADITTTLADLRAQGVVDA